MDTAQINYSIIIPHRNSGTLLKRLIGTIPQRNDIQLIVVDDCSDNDEFKLVTSLATAFPKIEIYSTDICGGGGKARNVGLKYAKGKYVLFADADDYFNLCFNDILTQYENSNFDIVYFAANSVDLNTYQNSWRANYFDQPISRFIETNDPLDIKYKFCVPWSKFVNLSMIKDNGIFFEESPIANDVRFSTLIDYHAKKIVADKKAIYCVTTCDHSTSAAKSMDLILKRMEIDAKRLKFMQEKEGISLGKRSYFLDVFLKIKENNDSASYKKALEICTICGINEKRVKKMLRKESIKNLIRKLCSSIGIKVVAV